LKIHAKTIIYFKKSLTLFQKKFPIPLKKKMQIFHVIESFLFPGLSLLSCPLLAVVKAREFILKLNSFSRPQKDPIYGIMLNPFIAALSPEQEKKCHG
jgi:hypothetical protein